MSSHLADLIAAGEVVERPASVVKELVENAVDAGASAVTVETEGGGIALIRVRDDGAGIAKDELKTAFLRHATSKLKSEEQLSSIGTLGFRGEALASIAAVSRIEVFSRTAEELTGASLSLTAGVPAETEETGGAVGTVITVRDLFFNTPARLKFMKKDTAENAAVHTLMRQLALSHPELSFRLIRDGEEALHSPGDGKLLSAVYAALGREFALSLLPVEGGGGQVTCRGFVTRPVASRGSRGMQHFFVNGRLVKSQLLTAALEEAYRNQMMKGKFPGCVLHVLLPTDEVDVNVHPAKTQVKFLHEKAVFDAVYYTVSDLLNKKPDPLPEQKKALPENPRGDFFREMSAKEFRTERASAPEAPPPAFRTAIPPMDTELRGVRLEAHDSAAVRPLSVSLPPRAEQKPRPATAFTVRPPQTRVVPPLPEPADTPPEPTPHAEDTQESVFTEETPWRIAGELLKTYIVCEDEKGTVHLIDKHAAHERILFDALKSRATPPMEQVLLAPVVAEPGEDAAAVLLERLPLLAEYGFRCEDFGGGALLIRALPSDIDPADAAATLEMLAEGFRSHRSTDPASLRDDILHTVACKAAVKAGMTSSADELAALVRRVQSGEIRYCPHGRPVVAELTKYQLEKMFKRA